MDNREQRRKVRHRLAVLRHAEEVSGNVAAPAGITGSAARRSTSARHEADGWMLVETAADSRVRDVFEVVGSRLGHQTIVAIAVCTCPGRLDRRCSDLPRASYGPTQQVRSTSACGHPAVLASFVVAFFERSETQETTARQP